MPNNPIQYDDNEDNNIIGTNPNIHNYQPTIEEIYEEYEENDSVLNNALLGGNQNNTNKKQ